MGDGDRMSDKHQFEIHIGPTAVESTVTIDGVSLTPYVQGVTVECNAVGGGATRITFAVTPFKAAPIDISGPFMAVPRCDQCANWREFDEEGLSRECRVLRSPASTCGVYTAPDFGCVKFRPKGKAGE